LSTFAIEDNDMPASELVAVITFAGLARRHAKILEVVGGTCGMKFMIAGRRPRAAFHAAPCFVVAGEVFWRAIGIGEVTDSNHRARNFLPELCGGPSTREDAAIRNVAGADQNHWIL